MFERRITKMRRVEYENRKFHDDWEDLYFFINMKDNAICLIYPDSILKSFNLK